MLETDNADVAQFVATGALRRWDPVEELAVAPGKGGIGTGDAR